MRVVVVLEPADAEPLVERTDALEHVTPQADAVHRGDADVEGSTVVLAPALRRELLHLLEIGVRDRDP